MRIKAVIDTNVYLSYLLLTQGRPSTIREVVEHAIMGTYIPVLPTPLIDELLLVTNRPKFAKRFASQSVASLLEELRAVGEMVEIDPGESHRHVQDSKDDYLLTAALNSRADFLVSGDRHLHEAKERIVFTRICTPAEFAALLIGDTR